MNNNSADFSYPSVYIYTMHGFILISAPIHAVAIWFEN